MPRIGTDASRGTSPRHRSTVPAGQDATEAGPAVPSHSEIVVDPAAPDYSRSDLGPLRGPRRRKPTAFGLPSTFGLDPEALRAERRRRMAGGWAAWEIETRLADPDAEQPGAECRGEFGPGGRWHPGCQGCAA